MSNKYPCVYYDNGKCQKFSDDQYTAWCDFDQCEYQTPSNGDRIRAMSDEALAEFLWVETDKTFNYCNVCEHYRTSAPHCAVRSMGRECIKARVNWLKQPYKEDA